MTGLPMTSSKRNSTSILTYVILPTGADGEAKLNAAAAANDLPDLFQMVSASNDNRGALYNLVELGLIAPVDDLLP